MLVDRITLCELAQPHGQPGFTPVLPVSILDGLERIAVAVPIRNDDATRYLADQLEQRAKDIREAIKEMPPCPTP